MIIALISFAALAVLVAFFARDARHAGDVAPEKQARWEQAISNERSAVGRILLQISRPISRSTIISRETSTLQWRALQKKVSASGAFGSDVEIFVSTQIAAAMIGFGGIAISSVSSGAARFGGLLISFSIALLPWNIVSKGSTRRITEVLEDLPVFAELLQMPIAAGMGIPPALKFTAERLQGPVANETLRMLDLIRVNPAEESAAFVEAGERLVVPEARAFFVALLQAHVEGARVASSLARQAEMLRTSAYQRKRAELKKLPIKLVLIIGMHFLPVLFIVALLPVMFGLGGR
jgi:Flp pilus assembly protein TadB